MPFILLANHQPLFNEGMRCVLTTNPDNQIIGIVRDSISVYEKVASLKPDILVVDLMLPYFSAIDIQQLNRAYPNLKIVILSTNTNYSNTINFLKDGAHGYLLKDCDPADMLIAIEEVSRGRFFLCNRVVHKAVDLRINAESYRLSEKSDELTRREHEVLRMAAAGHSSAYIAQLLGISRRTAETHRCNLMRKLGLSNTAELTRYAIRNGVLALGDE